MNNYNNFSVLHIRDYYPSKENPASSPWVYDQVKSIIEKDIDAVVISPTPYLPSFLRSMHRFYLYPKANKKLENYKGTIVVRPQYVKFPCNRFVGITLTNLTKSICKASASFNDIKLIHAHFGQNGVAALKLKKKLKVPLITSFYGYDSGRLAPLYASYYKELAKKGDAFLALSDDMKNDLIHLGFPTNKIIIHHLGIDIDKFKPVKVKNKKFVFLVVARLDEAKGVQDVICAFYRIKDSNMQLRIVGDGAYKADLVALVNKLNLKNQVVFINNFKAENPRKIVLDEMQNSNVVLLTSFKSKNGAKEGTPVVLMEAQACGKPCIATKHAGIPEVVIDKKTGFLTEERDIDSISYKMKILFSNKNLYDIMSKNACEHIKREFNQEIQINKLINIYKNFLLSN